MHIYARGVLENAIVNNAVKKIIVYESAQYSLTEATDFWRNYRKTVPVLGVVMTDAEYTFKLSHGMKEAVAIIKGGESRLSELSPNMDHYEICLATNAVVNTDDLNAIIEWLKSAKKVHIFGGSGAVTNSLSKLIAVTNSLPTPTEEWWRNVRGQDLILTTDSESYEELRTVPFLEAWRYATRIEFQAPKLDKKELKELFKKNNYSLERIYPFKMCPVERSVVFRLR